MIEWQPIETAPKDGTEVKIPYEIEFVRAFWCKDLKRWVLSYPLHVESIYTPQWWAPT